MTKTEAAIADLAAALTGEQLTMLQPSEPLLATLKEFRAFLRDATPEQLTIIDHINDRLHARMSPTELVKLVHSPAEADHHRLEGVDVVGQRIRSGRHKSIAAQIADLASLIAR
jgi:hypothetical protein